jgi:transposase
MIPFPGNARVWIALGQTDMRRGMDALARQVQHGLGHDPHCGDLYLFRGRQGDLIKVWTCNGFVPVTYLIMPPSLRMRAG